MTIKINDKYQIETDPYNFILQKSRVIEEGKRAGETEWSNIGYYPNLELAYKALMTKGLASEDLQGIEEVIDYLLYMHEDIKNSIRSVGDE